MELNKIINEDCLVTLKEMDDNFIDLIVTSPPYDNIRAYGGYKLNNFHDIAEQIYRVVKIGGVVVWVVSDQTISGNETGSSLRQALGFKDSGFRLWDTMIYAKPPRGAVGNNKGYWQAFEYMFVFVKDDEQPKTINLIKDRRNLETRGGDSGTKRMHDGTLKKVDRDGYGVYGRRTNIWEYQTGKGHSASDDIAHQHPAIFPEKLAEDHIISWTNKGDLVYDPFMGSGTVAVMAQKNGREFLGSEITEKYCEIAEERLRTMKETEKQEHLF